MLAARSVGAGLRSTSASRAVRSRSCRSLSSHAVLNVLSRMVCTGGDTPKVEHTRTGHPTTSSICTCACVCACVCVYARRVYGCLYTYSFVPHIGNGHTRTPRTHTRLCLYVHCCSAEIGTRTHTHTHTEFDSQTTKPLATTSGGQRTHDSTTTRTCTTTRDHRHTALLH